MNFPLRFSRRNRVNSLQTWGWKSGWEERAGGRMWQGAVSAVSSWLPHTKLFTIYIWQEATRPVAESSSSVTLWPFQKLDKEYHHGEWCESWRGCEDEVWWHKKEEESPVPCVLHQGREDDLRGEGGGQGQQLQPVPGRAHLLRPRWLQVTSLTFDNKRDHSVK